MKTLKGIIQTFPPVSHPGRIYGKYDFDYKLKKWVLNKDWLYLDNKNKATAHPNHTS